MRSKGLHKEQELKFPLYPVHRRKSRDLLDREILARFDSRRRANGPI